MLLPKGLPAERIAACAGVISDTHMPERCLSFPATLFDVLHGVDVILHAGDLGELWVMDRLSKIAPVIAVHGNDETEDAQRELPYQQLISIAEQRVLLWHSYYPDPVEERAKRGGKWQPKLARQVERGQQAGARIVIFGHMHVPLTYQYDGVLLVNPGAIASGGLFTRQAVQTVALLFICEDGVLLVIHVDLTAPDHAFTPRIDWESDFSVARDQFQTPIVEASLIEDTRKLLGQAYGNFEALKQEILPLLHPCWAGEKACVTREDLLHHVRDNSNILAEDREKVVAILSGRGS